MAGSLAGYLGRAAREPFTWGRSDCGMFLADWVHLARGIDPARDVRGVYASEAELARIMGRRGLPGFVARLARAAGLRSTRDIRAGSIAVIQCGDGIPVCAIYTGKGWALRDHRSIYVVPAGPRVVCAFEV